MASLVIAALACAPAAAQSPQTRNFVPEQLKDKVPPGGSVWTFALMPD